MPKDKSAFSELMAELEELDTYMAKSFPSELDEEDDDKIRAAADGDRDDDGVPDGKDPDATPATDDDDEYDEMAKALGVKPMTVNVDGKEQQAYDGMAVLKAMYAKLESLEAGNGGGDMLKGMEIVGGAVGKLMKQVKQQETLIKSMQEQLSAIGGQGSGRKAVLSVLEKSLSSGQDDGKGEVSGQEVLAKAQVAAGKGLLSAVEVAYVERMVGSGQAPSADVMSKINQA